MSAGGEVNADRKGFIQRPLPRTRRCVTHKAPVVPSHLGASWGPFQGAAGWEAAPGALSDVESFNRRQAWCTYGAGE